MDDIIKIGPHRLLCGDITAGAVWNLMGDEKADVIYSDPPWGPGNQQYWHTMRERGSAPRTSWHDFVDTFAGVCASHAKESAPVFVEMGMRWAEELAAAMSAAGFFMRHRWVVTYGPKKKPLPVTLNYFCRPSRWAVDHSGLAQRITHGMPDPAHGEPVTANVLRQVVQPGSVVLDPCTGLGMTARWTHKLGAHFRGTEMNATRLERTLSWLRAKAGP